MAAPIVVNYPLPPWMVGGSVISNADNKTFGSVPGVVQGSPAPQNAGLPGFGGTAGGKAVLTKTKTGAGSKPNGVFAGSNLQYVANPTTKRSLLKNAGYAVDASGPETARLNAAWDNYFKTKGLGAAAWNITPTQFDPTKTTPTSTSTTPTGGGRTTPAAAPSAASQVPDATTATVPGSPNFQNLYAGVKAPTDPVGNLAQFASKYAQDQANTQFNPVLAALNAGIGRQGADTNAADQGIAALYKPVQDLAAANVATAADPSKQGVKTVQDVGSSIGAAFGLGSDSQSQDEKGLGSAIGAATTNAAANLTQQGDTATAAAKAEQQIAAQGQTDSTNTWNNTEQTSINALRDQLLQAISGKAAAKASGVAAGDQLGQQLQSGYLSQLDQIATGKEQAAFADQSYQGGALKNTGAALDNASKTFSNKVAPIVLRDQLLGNAAQRANATKQLALQTQQFKQTTAVNESKIAAAAGGWGQYLSNPKNAVDFAGKLRQLLVDPKTGQPIAGTTPSSAYNTVAHTMASAGFPANTAQGQQLLVNALQGAGFDLTGYTLDPQRGLVLTPKTSGGTGPHALTLHKAGATIPPHTQHGKGY